MPSQNYFSESSDKPFDIADPYKKLMRTSDEVYALCNLFPPKPLVDTSFHLPREVEEMCRPFRPLVSGRPLVGPALPNPFYELEEKRRQLDLEVESEIQRENQRRRERRRRAIEREEQDKLIEKMLRARQIVLHPEKTNLIQLTEPPLTSYFTEKSQVTYPDLETLVDVPLYPRSSGSSMSDSEHQEITDYVLKNLGKRRREREERERQLAASKAQNTGCALFGVALFGTFATGTCYVGYSAIKLVSSLV